MGDDFRILLEFLGRELDSVSVFFALLKEEEIVLNQGEPDLLEALVAKKQLAIVHLQQLDSEREALFANAGVSIKAGDISQSIFSGCGDLEGELASTWGALQDLVRRIHDQHELNGQLIAAYQQKNSAALSVLLQGLGQGDLNLYNKIGTASPFSTRRLVDSA